MTLVDVSSIREEGYMAYVDSTRSTILVSEFESTVYECTGTCYCEIHDDYTNNIERRRILSPGTLRFIKWYVIIGTTAIIGKFAYDLFTKKCEKELDGTCDPENVRTENEQCSPVEEGSTPPSSSSELTPPEVEYFDNNNDDNPVYKISRIPSERDLDEYYFCTGNCQRRVNFKGEDQDLESEVVKTEREGFGCEEIQLDLNLDGNLVTKYFRDLLIKGSEEEEVKNEDLVKAVFAGWHLSTFCSKSSEVIVNLKGSKRLTREISVCDAGQVEERMMTNPTVRCIRGFQKNPKRVF